MIYGTLDYQNEKYIFSIEGSLLCMERMDDLGRNCFDPSWLVNPPSFEDDYLEGINAENGKVLFIMPAPGSAGFKGTKIRVRINYYFELTQKSEYDSISIHCDELNYFYDMRQAIERQNMKDNGQTTLLIKDFSATTSESEVFSFHGKQIKLYFTIYRALHFQRTEPVSLESWINFTFDSTSDLSLAVDLCRLTIQFLAFVCNRKSIGVLSVTLYKNKRSKVGTVFFPNRVITQEPRDIVKDRLLSYDGIQGHVGMLFQDIANDNIYLRHIPLNYQMSTITDYAKFILTTAAIEWVFTNLYPNGVKHSPKTVKAINTVRTVLENQISQSKGKEKDLYKFFSKILQSESLSQKIVQIGKDNDEICKIIGLPLYRINDCESEFQYSRIGKRIETQRNDFAHGNIKKDFEGLSVLDLLFLERVLYLLQLKRYCGDTTVLVAQVKKLFGVY